MRNLATLLMVFLLAGCQVAPGTGREGFNIVSAEEERAMGAEAHPGILRQFGGALDQSALQAYVAGIGQRLVRASETPEAEFRFTVLDSPVVNAMALPGGYVYVTRGLLALVADEAELAGVIGHEIGHVTGRHTAERYSQGVAANVLTGLLGAVIGIPGIGEVASLGADAYLQSYSRDQESEADQLGIRYLSRAGWRAGAMASFLDKLHEEAKLEALLTGRSADAVDRFDFMASHPRTIDRVQAAAQSVAQSAGGVGGFADGDLGRERLLAAVDGLPFGEHPRDGVMRKRVFLHPGLGFRFEVPEGFRVANGDSAVVASAADGSLIRFDMATDGRADPAGYLRSRWLKEVQPGAVESLSVGGLPAATGGARVQTDKGAMEMRLAAVESGPTVYRFMLLAPPHGIEARAAEFRRTVDGFRLLTEDERARLRGRHVKVVTVKAGDTPESLAERLPFERYRLERFRVLNGLGPADTLSPGQKVKLVVE